MDQYQIFTLPQPLARQSDKREKLPAPCRNSLELIVQRPRGGEHSRGYCSHRPKDSANHFDVEVLEPDNWSVRGGVPAT